METITERCSNRAEPARCSREGRRDCREISGAGYGQLWKAMPNLAPKWLWLLAPQASRQSRDHGWRRLGMTDLKGSLELAGQEHNAGRCFQAEIKG
jgi:hypothetical protein